MTAFIIDLVLILKTKTKKKTALDFLVLTEYKTKNIPFIKLFQEICIPFQ